MFYGYFLLWLLLVNSASLVKRNTRKWWYFLSLKAAFWPIGEVSMEVGKKSIVEMCSCPIGYTGLSCESCAWGYVKVAINSTDIPIRHKCVRCDCNGHAGSCNLMMGECSVSKLLLLLVQENKPYINVNLLKYIFYRLIL